jgi:hypothetical protein
MVMVFRRDWLVGCAGLVLVGSLAIANDPTGPEQTPADDVPAIEVEVAPVDEQPATPAGSHLEAATHKQIRSLRPSHNGQPIHLNTFCLNTDGSVLACVGGFGGYSVVIGPDGQPVTNPNAAANFVQVYSPDGELTAEWAVPFRPTAINVAKDETIYVAGEGKIARLSNKGEILTTADIPQTGDPEEQRRIAREQAEAQSQQFIERLEQQIEYAEQRAATIRDTAEEERTPAQVARLAAYERQQELYRVQIDQLKEQAAAMAAAPASVIGVGGQDVKALAVSDSYVFVCASSAAGSGYDVLRCDYDFQNPRQVMSGLRGCCGQMDIQAYGDQVFVAENTKFRVGVHDAEGELVTSFGSQDRTGKTGFGSCCNPMNVRCCPNGDVLTAESSIGDIKRFTPEGEFVGYVGRARISGGCKHVAIGWDQHRDRYYMMNISDSSICVLVPTSEAPEFTEYELAAKEAKEGLGRKLVGEWAMPGTKTTAPRRQSQSVFSQAINSLFGGSSQVEVTVSDAEVASNAPFERVTFGENGELTLVGGMYGQWGVTDWTWQPVAQNAAARTVDFDMLTGGIQYQTMRVELVTDTEAKISVLSGGEVSMTTRFERKTATDADNVPTDVHPVPEETAVEAAPAAGP